MTRASSLAFPGSGILAAWWQQLAAHQPVSLAVGYFFVHRLEARALWQQEQPLDPLAMLVLQAVGLEQARDDTVVSTDRLQRRLRLDSGLILHLARSLREANLLEYGSLEAGFQLSVLGRAALRSGAVPARDWRGEEFTFIENLGPSGERLAAPHFLRLAAVPAGAWQPGAETTIDISCLRACLAKSLAWKAAFGFPQDVIAFAEPTGDSMVALENVIIDRPERILTAIVETPHEDVLVFGVRPDGWTLLAGEPIANLSVTALAELGWQRAAPLSNGDTWLLAGEGYMRQALRREMMPAPVGV